MMRGATHGETEVKRRRFNEKSSKIKGPRASGVPPERLWAPELLQNTLEPNSDGFLVDLGSPWGGHFRLEFAQGCKKDVQKLLFLVVFFRCQPEPAICVSRAPFGPIFEVKSGQKSMFFLRRSKKDGCKEIVLPP